MPNQRLNIPYPVKRPRSRSAIGIPENPRVSAPSTLDVCHEGRPPPRQYDVEPSPTGTPQHLLYIDTGRQLDYHFAEILKNVTATPVSGIDFEGYAQSRDPAEPPKTLTGDVGTIQIAYCPDPSKAIVIHMPKLQQDLGQYGLPPKIKEILSAGRFASAVAIGDQARLQEAYGFQIPSMADLTHMYECSQGRSSHRGLRLRSLVHLADSLGITPPEKGIDMAAQRGIHYHLSAKELHYCKQDAITSFLIAEKCLFSIEATKHASLFSLYHRDRKGKRTMEAESPNCRPIPTRPKIGPSIGWRNTIIYRGGRGPDGHHAAYPKLSNFHPFPYHVNRHPAYGVNNVEQGYCLLKALHLNHY